MLPPRMLSGMRSLLILGVLLGCLPAAAGSPRYTVIVSNNASNDPSQLPLRFADDDGARFYELLAPQSDEAHLLAVLDEDTQARHPGLAARTRAPTEAELLQTLARLNARMDADREAGLDPVLFFVFTGHGKRGAAGEGSISLLGSDFGRSDLFEKVLAKSRARFVHLVVDACDSYFFVNARGALPRAEGYAAAVRGLLDERTLESYPQVGVILSTASERESHEWEGIRGGVFSHQVRSALAGAADVNGDGKVEYSELRAFVAAASARVRDPRARPEVFARAPAQDRAQPLFDLTRPGGLGFLSVPAALAGRFWVEDERGVRLYDFHKEPLRPLVLAVPADRQLFLRQASGEARFRVAPGAVQDGQALTFKGVQVASRGALDQTFREDLFQVAYGPSFYAGFVASTGELPVTPAAGPDLD
jgi:hypothetical protein